MDNKQNEDRIIFSITAEDLQQEAIRCLGRRLTDEELDIATKCIDGGLSTGIDTVFKTAIEEAVLKKSIAYHL
jgi:hypothetical protein